MYKKVIIFAPIAERESVFYVKVGQKIYEIDKDIKIKFISFYQPYNQVIEKEGFDVFDIYSISNKKRSDFDIKAYEERFNIDNMHKKILHEKLTFGIHNSEKLLKKFCYYLDIIDEYLTKLKKQYNKIIVFQELGGFIAPLSLYYACRKNLINHIFFEPSFFKGRIHNILNSLAPITLPDKLLENIDNEMVNYLENTIKFKNIVIPDKDRHHFLDMGIKKIINTSNIKKIFFKLKYKYIKKYKQEYEHILNHVKRYIFMYINRKMLTNLYSVFSDKIKKNTYIYFPFHVQLDYALTIRSPQYLNQLAFIEYICSILPTNVYLYVKEHPASIGGFNYWSLRKLLRTYDNLRLIHPKVNSFDLVNHSLLVLTINSKTGAEALVLGKEVIVVGEAFYSRSNCVHFVDNTKYIDKVIKRIINGNIKNSKDKLIKMFSYLWHNSYQSELYNLNDKNVEEFAKSILLYNE